MAEKLGILLRYLREGSGMTQEELAAVLSVSVSSVSNYETGRGEPSISTVRNIVAYFGVTADYLLGLSDRFMISFDGLDKQEVSFLMNMIHIFKDKPKNSKGSLD